MGLWRPLLLGLWCVGAVLSALVALRRTARFACDVRGMLPASERVRRLTADLAAMLGLRRPPEVLYAERLAVPLLWCAGRRPTIVLPMGLLRDLDEQSVAFIVAHELAHLRRRDHWVRFAELIVSVVHWWNPLVWFVRRRIHEAEEMCCDAWVRWWFPNEARRYAEVLLRAAEWRDSHALKADARPLPPPASPFLRSFFLKSRIQMVLESRFSPSLSRRGAFALAVAACAVLALPAFVPAALRKAQAGANDEKPRAAPAPKAKPAALATHEFPCAVRFERGATRFLKDDTITVLEIRGTAETFEPGNLYWIRGTYKLGSHDRATLAAYTTARDARYARSSSLKVQTTVVNKGDGTFTLFLPMTCEGWPHVSFYPADGGGDFGGNYFGTGNSVLKHWWGSNKDR